MKIVDNFGLEKLYLKMNNNYQNDLIDTKIVITKSYKNIYPYMYSIQVDKICINVKTDTL